jgi:hypothetical protein
MTMRYLTWILGVLVFAWGGGCYFGSDPGKSFVAKSQYGIRIGLHFHATEDQPDEWADRPVRIELLAVTEEGLLVEDGAAIWLFTYGSFKSVEFLDNAGAKDLEGNPPPPDRLEMARLLSRYPYGLTDDQLAFLLADRGQEALIVREKSTGL